jgi:hypothetical protein
MKNKYKKNLKEMNEKMASSELPKNKEELIIECEKIDDIHLPFMCSVCPSCLKLLFGFLNLEPFFINHTKEGYASLCNDCYTLFLELKDNIN